MSSRTPELNILPDLPIIRVLLDARKIQGGGIGVYIKNIIAGIAQSRHVHLTALVLPEHKSVVRNLGSHDVITDSSKLYSIDELFFLSRRIDFSNYDLFHVPHYTLPFFIPIPTVVTVHDIIHITHPEKFYYPFIAKRLIKSSLKRADRIVTVSESTKRSLEKINKKIGSKISVIPNAVDPQFFLEDTSLHDNLSQSRKPYIMATFSNTKPHKGFKDLVKSFTEAKIIVRDGNYSKALKERIDSLTLKIIGTGVESIKGQNQSDGIEVIGAVDIEQLKYFYKNAQALIVSSYEEGFCLPVIESQACGTPVIARPSSAVLELMTTNDHVAKDMTVQSLQTAIIEFFSKRIDRPELVDYGVPLSHMRRFDREALSDELISMYRGVLK